MDLLSPRPLGLYALLVCLAWATLPLGSNRPWAVAITLPCLLLLALFTSWRRPAAPDAPSLPGWLARGPGLPVAGFLVLLVLQWLPIGQQPPWSVVPARTLAFLQMAFGCAVTAWLVVRLVASGRDVRHLLYGLVGIGLLQAVIAVALMADHAVVPLFDSEIVGTGVATGTFANRNHFAACLNMALSAGIGLLMGSLAASGEPRTWRQRLRGWLELSLSGKAKLRLLLVLLVVTLIATRSRMGNSAFFIGLLVASSIYAAFSRRRRRNLWLFVASLVVVDVVLIGAWVGVDKVVERVQNTNLMRDVQAPVTVSKLPDLLPDLLPDTPTQAAGSVAAGAGRSAGSSIADAAPSGESTDGASTRVESSGSTSSRSASTGSTEQSLEDRTDPAVDALAIVREHPWLGTGAGSFFVAYMAYARKDQGFYNHAHNDYLELAADTGLLGLGLLLAFAAWSFVVAVRILRRRRNPDLRAAACASIMAMVVLALQSLVDFNLQIPANAWLFSAMLALPLAAARVPRRGEEGAFEVARARFDRSGGGARRPTAERVADGARALLASALLIASGWTVMRLGLADYVAIAANSQMTLWEQGDVQATPTELDAVERSLLTAISIAPENPEYYETLGNVHFARALLPADGAAADQPVRSADQRRLDLQAAAGRYREALARNRVSPYTWSSLLAAKSRLLEVDDEFRLALANAARFGPFEPNVQGTILSTGLAAWSQLTVEDRRLVAQTVTRGWPTNRDRLAAEARADSYPFYWCALSPDSKPLVDSPPDIMQVMMGLCRVAATLTPNDQQ